jgi:MFS transporter, OFA family, oxalate/formate antiporter
MIHQFANTSISEKSSASYSRILIAVSMVIIFISTGSMLAIGIFYKPILMDFGWSRGVLSGPIAISFLMCSLMNIFLGNLADRIGSRNSVIICGVLTGAGYLLMTQITSIWHVYLIYGIIIGSGTAVTAPIYSNIARWFPKRRTATTSALVAANGLGGTVVPLIANQLLDSPKKKPKI